MDWQSAEDRKRMSDLFVLHFFVKKSLRDKNVGCSGRFKDILENGWKAEERNAELSFNQEERSASKNPLHSFLRPKTNFADLSLRNEQKNAILKASNCLKKSSQNPCLFFWESIDALHGGKCMQNEKEIRSKNCERKDGRRWGEKFFPPPFCQTELQPLGL